MANECLVTKLKGVVDNPNLRKLGELKFNVDIASGYLAPFWIESSSQFTATITGDGYFYKGSVDSQTDITTSIENITNTQGYRISPGVSTISISPKYGIKNFTLNPGSPSVYNSISLDCSDLKYGGLESLQLAFPAGLTQDVFLDVDSINFGALKRFFIANIKATGNIVNIAKALVYDNSVQTIVIGLANSNPMVGLTGNIEAFVENIEPAGYGCKIILQSNKFTFHNSTLNATVLITTDSNGNATVIKEVDSSILATYNRQSNTWTYV